MHAAPVLRVESVRADEDTARSKHTAHLCQRGILSRCRRDVVQHRQAGHGGKARAVERQFGRVSDDDAHVIGTRIFGQTGGELTGEVSVKLGGGNAGNESAEDICGPPRTWPDLEQVIAEITTFKYPGQEIIGQVGGPLRTRAQG